ncbi:MAG TPA: hypothetical protein VGF98_02225 [Candidatus Tumulicola sp.]|jgi:hypothetical protein
MEHFPYQDRITGEPTAANAAADYKQQYSLLRQKLQDERDRTDRIETKAVALFAGTIAVLGFSFEHVSSPVDAVVLLIFFWPLYQLYNAIKAIWLDDAPSADELAEKFAAYPQTTFASAALALADCIRENAGKIDAKASHMNKGLIAILTVIFILIVAKFASNAIPWEKINARISGPEAIGTSQRFATKAGTGTELKDGRIETGRQAETANSQVTEGHDAKSAPNSAAGEEVDERGRVTGKLFGVFVRMPVGSAWASYNRGDEPRSNQNDTALIAIASVSALIWASGLILYQLKPWTLWRAATLGFASTAFMAALFALFVTPVVLRYITLSFFILYVGLALLTIVRFRNRNFARNKARETAKHPNLAGYRDDQWRGIFRNQRLHAWVGVLPLTTYPIVFFWPTTTVISWTATVYTFLAYQGILAIFEVVQDASSSSQNQQGAVVTLLTAFLNKDNHKD